MCPPVRSSSSPWSWAARSTSPDTKEHGPLGRELGLPIALHVVGTFGMQPTFDEIGAAGLFGPDNIFIYMIGMSDRGWRYAADDGARVSLAVPIEMHMRDGTPPIQRTIDLAWGCRCRRTSSAP